MVDFALNAIRFLFGYIKYVVLHFNLLFPAAILPFIYIVFSVFFIFFVFKLIKVFF